MKKKLLAVLMVTAMVVTCVACGKTDEGTGSKKENSEESKVEEVADTSVVEAVADANGNYILNGSFEEMDFTGWKVTNVDNATEELDIYTRATDCYEGVQCLHFYSGATNVDFMAEQTLKGLEAGSYKLTAYVQGDATEEEVTFYVTINGTEYKVAGELNGYVNWYTAELPGISVAAGDEVVVGIKVTTSAGGWGTIDAISLVKE